MNTKSKLLTALSLTMGIMSCVPVMGAVPTGNLKPIKNVILLIPDGQSVGATTLSRWYKGENLAMDEMVCGLVRTYSSDSAIADSAPAGTAMATGFKSHTGYVGILPDVNNMPGMSSLEKGQEKLPVANILEASQLQGKSTGIISTSEIMHATPAAFSSHNASRKNYDSISEQQVYKNIDVVLGSGSTFFNESREDGENLIEEIKNLGYTYVTDKNQMQAATSSKLWGLFSEEALPYDFDSDKTKQPSLSEMTEKAIETLNKDEDGFFLMAEGSKVDWAAHANDPIGIISDTLAFDDAVKTALDFAKKDGQTIVITATDHGNSGITIGNKNTDTTYDKVHIDDYINPLKKATLTGEGIEKMLNTDKTNIVEVMDKYYGISDLTEEEIKEIKDTKTGSMNYTVGPMIAKRANIGFTTTGHTGEDIPLYIYCPKGYEMTGVVENTDIAKYMEKVMGLSLESTTKELFVPARKEFEAKGAKVSMDSTDKKNPVLVVTKGTQEIKMPVDKNIAYVNGKKVTLSGVVINNTIETFVPKSALDLIQ